MHEEEQTWLRVQDTARLLQIPLTRCYELIHAGALPGAVRVGERSIRVNRQELEAGLLERHRVNDLGGISLPSAYGTPSPGRRTRGRGVANVHAAILQVSESRRAIDAVESSSRDAGGGGHIASAT